jgi:hypothetical protein
MAGQQANNLLHGVTLEMILQQLVAHYGWEALGREIDIRCFNHEPSIASSLKFLRRTPWAREASSRSTSPCCTWPGAERRKAASQLPEQSAKKPASGAGLQWAEAGRITCRWPSWQP